MQRVVAFGAKGFGIRCSIYRASSSFVPLVGVVSAASEGSQSSSNTKVNFNYNTFS